MLCTELLAKVKEESGSLFAEPLYCRSWGCEICRKRRARELRWLARSGEPETFLTLTVNPEREDGPDGRARALRRAWRLVRAAMKKKFPGRKFPFIAVFEATKKGEPHLHILFRGPYVEQKWISQQMARLTGSPIVDIRGCRDKGRAAAYISKYIGKAPTVWDGCKRYWRSQDWQLMPDDPSPKTWTRLWVVRRGIAEIYHDMATTGVTTAETLRGGRLTFGWWTGDWTEARR